MQRQAAEPISIEPLSPLNREAVLRLAVAPHQARFVAANAASLAEADSEPHRYPFAIRSGDAVVGFAMYALDPDDGNYWIYRLMIDAAQQGRGIGRAALLQLIDHMSALPDCPRILLGIVPGNEAAAALYAGAGFVPTGQIIGGEQIMGLELGR